MFRCFQFKKGLNGWPLVGPDMAALTIRWYGLRKEGNTPGRLKYHLQYAEVKEFFGYYPAVNVQDWILLKHCTMGKIILLKLISYCRLFISTNLRMLLFPANQKSRKFVRLLNTHIIY